MNKYPCPKCDGNKVIKGFDHVQGGVCFKCAGSGFIMQKSAPKKSKEFNIAFLWTDPTDVNYLGGEYCSCGKIVARSKSDAEKKAVERMQKNGSASYLLTES